MRNLSIEISGLTLSQFKVLLRFFVTYWAKVSRGLELKDVQLTLGIPIIPINEDNVLDDGYERTLSFELRNSGGTLLDRREDVNLGDLNSGKNVISMDANVRLHEVFSLRVRVYENFENSRKSIGTYSIHWFRTK